VSTRHKITFGLIKSSSHAYICRLRNLNRSKNDQGAACLADRSYFRVLVQRLARRLAQSRTSRRLRESDERQHMQNNQINSNEQPNKHHEMIEHDFRKVSKKSI